MAAMSEFDAIPQELKDRPQWICWAETTRNGKSTKIPKQADGSGNNAKANDIATWGTFQQAVREAGKRDNWGIGFVFSSADPYVGIDIDTCLNSRGGPREWLLNIGLDAFNGETYIERSPSVTGLHVIVKDAAIPEWWTNQDRDTDERHEGVEVYEDGRYFTFTGDKIDTSADSVSDDVDLEAWLRDAWDGFNDEAPQQPQQTGRSGEGHGEDINVDVHDIILRSQFPEGERRGHPVHGSDTGSNFMVDGGAETWRCWRHGCTGNALQLLGVDEGIIECGDWTNGSLTNSQWSDIFDAARERGLDVPEKKSGKPKSAAEEAREAHTDGGAAAAEAPQTQTTTHQSLADRVRSRVLTPVDPPEDYEGEQIDNETAVQRFVELLDDEHHFVRPRSDVRGWRDTLYHYVPEEGIYEPHGEVFIANTAESLLGPWATNQRIKEITGKIERRSLVRPGELTADPERLCVANGIVDLHTAAMYEHTPDEYHRTKLDVKFDPSAECPRIEEFFGEIVESKDVGTLYRLVAHCIYKEYAAEKAAMLVGDGQNGKSVFLSLVEEFLGDFNVSHRALQEFSENDFAANDLEGKLANVHPDMGDEMVRDLGTFKKLTGRDTMTANVKYEKPITFENHATMLFAANRMPIMDEDTHALWRRWIYLNFPYTFDDGDPTAKDEIPKRKLMSDLTEKSELEGLLARCVKEISEWWDGRPWFPDVMQPAQVREKMKRASEPVYDFVAACVEIGDEEDYVPKDQLRQAYREYARQEGLPTKTDNAFGEEILNIRDYPIESGRKRVDGQRVRVYQGVVLTPKGRQVLGLDSSDTDQDLEEASTSRINDIVKATEQLDNGDGATRAMILGRASNYMSITIAEDAFERAKERGRISSHNGEHFFAT